MILRDREIGPERVDQLAARLTAAGCRPIRPATLTAALGELHAAGLAAVDDHDRDKLTGRWAALPVARGGRRHPRPVIDELMGHQAQ